MSHAQGGGVNFSPLVIGHLRGNFPPLTDIPRYTLLVRGIAQMIREALNKSSLFSGSATKAFPPSLELVKELQLNFFLSGQSLIPLPLSDRATKKTLFCGFPYMLHILLAYGLCVLVFHKKDICEHPYDANQCMDREAEPTNPFCPVIGSLLPASTLIGRYDQNGLTIIPLYEDRGIYALPF